MTRAAITLALCVVAAATGCSKPATSSVRLVREDRPKGCHLTLNGVRIPDDVLAAKGQKQRGEQGVTPSGNDEPDSCLGAKIAMQQSGMKVDQMPVVDLGR